MANGEALIAVVCPIGNITATTKSGKAIENEYAKKFRRAEV